MELELPIEGVRQACCEDVDFCGITYKTRFSHDHNIFHRSFKRPNQTRREGLMSRNLHRPPSLHSSWHACYRSPLTCPASLPPSFPRSPLHGRPRPAASVPAPKPSFAHNPQGGRDRASPLSHAQWEDGAACVCLRPALSTWVWHLMPLHRPIAVRLCRVTRIDKLIHAF